MRDEFKLTRVDQSRDLWQAFVRAEPTTAIPPAHPTPFSVAEIESPQRTALATGQARCGRGDLAPALYCLGIQSKIAFRGLNAVKSPSPNSNHSPSNDFTHSLPTGDFLVIFFALPVPVKDL